MQLKSKRSPMSTRAIKFLEAEKAPFEVVRYEHDRKGAAFAAQAVGFALEKTIKSLVVSLGEKRFALALMPGNRELDLKRMARACRVKKAAMALPKEAERLTGCKVGGISPFGIRPPLPCVMEKDLLAHDAALINGGQRGVMLKMAPVDIARLLGCAVSEIARTRHPGP